MNPVSEDPGTVQGSACRVDTWLLRKIELELGLSNPKLAIPSMLFWMVVVTSSSSTYR